VLNKEGAALEVAHLRRPFAPLMRDRREQTTPCESGQMHSA
jgi:hypothetical protein